MSANNSTSVNLHMAPVPSVCVRVPHSPSLDIGLCTTPMKKQPFDSDCTALAVRECATRLHAKSAQYLFYILTDTTHQPILFSYSFFRIHPSYILYKYPTTYYYSPLSTVYFFFAFSILSEFRLFNSIALHINNINMCVRFQFMNDVHYMCAMPAVRICIDRPLSTTFLSLSPPPAYIWLI